MNASHIVLGMLIVLGLLVLVVLALLLPVPARAQTLTMIATSPCFEIPQARAIIRSYHEERVGLGLQSKKDLVELTVSASGSWTITRTSPNGFTCFIAGGDDWQAVKPEIKGDPS